MNQGSLLNKIRQIYIEGGLGELARRAGKRLVHSAYHGNEALWFSVDTPEMVSPRADWKEEPEVVSDPSVETIEYIRQNGYYHPREVEVGLRYRHIYSRLLVDGRIVGYNKLALSRVYISDFGRCFTLPGSVAFTYDTMISEEARGQGLGGFLLFRAIEQGVRLGIRRVWAHIPLWNKASLRMHGKLGFRVKRHVRFHHVMGLKLYSDHPSRLFEDG